MDLKNMKNLKNKYPLPAATNVAQEFLKLFCGLVNCSAGCQVVAGSHKTNQSRLCKQDKRIKLHIQYTTKSCGHCFLIDTQNKIMDISINTQ